MTPQEIEQMKADMEAGTEGPWRDRPRDSYVVLGRDGNAGFGLSAGPPDPESIANTRRALRVPDMEAEILRLREALERIGNLSPEPDDKEWHDDWGDPCEYRFVGRDGQIFTASVDTSNSGDVSSHAYEQGLHSACVIARRALNGDAP